MLPIFDVFMPATLSEALSFLSENGARTKILAGGTDLIPSMKQRLFEPQYLLDLKSLDELYGIRELADGSLSIGALSTISEIADNGMLARECSVLHQAALTVAGPSLRNVGTIGGNICLDTRCYWYNQSFFWRESCGFCIKKDGTLCHVAPGSKQCWAVYSADTPPALLTLDAEIKLSSSSGNRIIPLREFYVNDGLIKNKIRQDEILTGILIPSSSRGFAGSYEKFRMRGSVDYPLAGVAISMNNLNGAQKDFRVALTAVNPRPVLLKDVIAETNGASGTELIEIVRALAMKTAKPLKTSASTMEYRRHMVGVMVKRSLEKLGIEL